jgi:hypothetical protein
MSCAHDWDPYDPRLSGGVGGDGNTGPGGSTASSGANGGSAPSSSGSAATGGAGGGGGAEPCQLGGGPPGPGTVTYPAAFAGCVDPTDPDIDICEQYSGPGNMSVDLEETRTGNPSNSYIRFDLDGILDGHTVSSVTLRVTVTDLSDADSTESGEIWEVLPFTAVSLDNMVPARISGSPVADSQGPVTFGQQVDFDLPTSMVAACGSVYLVVYPVQVNGAKYWNTNGDVPPELIVDYQ